MTSIEDSRFSKRSALGLEVSEDGLFVELGVAAGKFGVEVLQRFPKLHYLGIDRWNDHHNEAEESRARALLRPYNGRACLQRSTFSQAAGYIPEESCDVVYVDGYAHTGQDEGVTLEMWWPKVKRGGLLAGHDYDLDKWPKTFKAVNYFAGSRGLRVEVIEEPGGYASWKIRRPLTDNRLINGACVLVGNGPSLLTGNLGALIDGFDEVVRFNNFVIDGFTASVGTKTTLWCCYGANAKREASDRPERIAYLHGAVGVPGWYEPREIWRVRIEFYHDVQARVRAASKKPEDQKKKLLPSAGLVMLCWLLERHGVDLVHLAGFDHFNNSASKKHHYWLPGNHGPPPEHDGEAEAGLVAQMASMGQVRHLKAT